tara:strand:+ start:504 stop:995 length:492 start_codon:yes stop_codon:yes gene_type:complete
MVKTVRELKDDAEFLEDSEKVIKGIINKVRTFNSKKHFDYVMSLNVILSELIEKSIVLERITSFIYYLAVLKIAVLNKNFKETKKVLKQCISNKHIKLSYLIKEIVYFEKKVLELAPLLRKLNLKKEAKLLLNLSKVHRILIFNVALTFSSFAKELIVNKHLK